MLELLKNAWAGWLRYTDNGKFAALLLVVLLFCWFCEERRSKGQNKELLIYAMVMTVLCIVPVSAALLQLYQTPFYDYEWIWSYVPVTIMIAYGITVFLVGRWRNYQKEVRQKGNTVTKKSFWENIAITVSVAVLVFLCGKIGNPIFAADVEAQERLRAQKVLEVLLNMEGQVQTSDAQEQRENSREQTSDAQEQQKGLQGAESTLVLWAPREVMGYARAHDGNIHLIYGRDMWDKSLQAYSYENYGDVKESLYHWMKSVEENGEQSTQEFLEGGVPCVEAALEQGVNCVILPGETSAENVNAFENVLNQRAESIEGYYVWKWN